MSDQIGGDWYTALLGLDPVLPPERIRLALEAIFRYNYNPEDGLRNASYPPGKETRLSTFQNYQAEAPWTGVEYTLASMLISYGLVNEGIEIVRNVYDRYLRAGRIWNHVECGDHYYRAMASWAVLLSLSGFRADAARQALTFSPALPQQRFRVPYVTTASWGTLTQERDSRRHRITLLCRGGAERLGQLRLGASLDAGRVAAQLNGRAVTCQATREGALTVVTFAEEVEVKDGDTLCVADT